MGETRSLGVSQYTCQGNKLIEEKNNMIVLGALVDPLAITLTKYPKTFKVQSKISMLTLSHYQ